MKARKHASGVSKAPSAAKKPPAIPCEQISPNRWHNAPRVVGRGATRDAAETSLRDKLLDLVEKDRKADKVECNGKCEGGGACYTTFELSGNVQFKRAKRGPSRVWLCVYQGQLTSSCMCA